MWDFGDSFKVEGIDLSNPPSHIYYINKDGQFDVKLMVRNPNQCIEKSFLKIGINLTLIPNTFAPNYYPPYLEGWYIKIYNRNGILLYEGKDGWDGTYKGNPVTNDTYFVIVYDYGPPQKGAKYRTNYVTVIR
jgi:hypothetical protein